MDHGGEAEWSGLRSQQQRVWRFDLCDSSSERGTPSIAIDLHGNVLTGSCPQEMLVHTSAIPLNTNYPAEIKALEKSKDEAEKAISRAEEDLLQGVEVRKRDSKKQKRTCSPSTRLRCTCTIRTATTGQSSFMRASSRSKRRQTRMPSEATSFHRTTCHTTRTSFGTTTCHAAALGPPCRQPARRRLCGSPSTSRTKKEVERTVTRTNDQGEEVEEKETVKEPFFDPVMMVEINPLDEVPPRVPETMEERRAFEREYLRRTMDEGDGEFGASGIYFLNLSSVKRGGPVMEAMDNPPRMWSQNDLARHFEQRAAALAPARQRTGTVWPLSLTCQSSLGAWAQHPISGVSQSSL